jgi:hypothetical protein
MAMRRSFFFSISERRRSLRMAPYSAMSMMSSRVISVFWAIVAISILVMFQVQSARP